MSPDDNMAEHPVVYSKLPEYPLWEKMLVNRKLIGFNLEVTARCNNNCRHCFTNLPASDSNIVRQELSIEEIDRISSEAVEMGALWCLITGGEPLLRKDFKEIYLLLKRKGLLITVFTNATLITEDIVKLFKQYPLRTLEISVYGITRETYEKITRKKGTFEAFMRGITLLSDNGIPFNLKSMALKSNLHELDRIERFCRERSRAKYRYDPMLHLRYDRDPKKNEEIIAERLSPEEIVFLETNDTERFGEIKKKCDGLFSRDTTGHVNDYAFRCFAGRNEFSVSYDGKLKLCLSLCEPSLVYDLRAGNSTIKDAHNRLLRKAHTLRSQNKEFLDRCGVCKISNLCICCPAHAWLENGRMDTPVDYFCAVAKARASAISKSADLKTLPDDV